MEERVQPSFSPAQAAQPLHEFRQDDEPQLLLSPDVISCALFPDEHPREAADKAILQGVRPAGQGIVRQIAQPPQKRGVGKMGKLFFSRHLEKKRLPIVQQQMQIFVEDGGPGKNRANDIEGVVRQRVIHQIRRLEQIGREAEKNILIKAVIL